MSILSVQTKKVPELPATTGLVGADLFIAELANGGTRKITFSNLMEVVMTELAGDEDFFLRSSDIVSVQTDSGEKVPAAALVKDMYDRAVVMEREKQAPYDDRVGIEWDIDELMALVRAQQWHKFALGDYFIDTRSTGKKVQWVVADKNGYLHCGDYGNGLTSPNIICEPRDCLDEKTKYNASNTNTGGYAASLMPAYLNNTILPTFSAKLRSYITEVRRLENNKGNWAWASRKLFIPSITELTGLQGWADQYSGIPVCHALGIHTGGNAYLMKGQGFRKELDQRTWYWTADPADTIATVFCCVGSDGSSITGGAGDNNGLAPLIVLT